MSITPQKQNKNKPGVVDFGNCQPTKMSKDAKIKRCVLGKPSLEKKISYSTAFS